MLSILLALSSVLALTYAQSCPDEVMMQAGLAFRECTKGIVTPQGDDINQDTICQGITTTLNCQDSWAPCNPSVVLDATKRAMLFDILNREGYDNFDVESCPITAAMGLTCSAQEGRQVIRTGFQCLDDAQDAITDLVAEAAAQETLCSAVDDLIACFDAAKTCVPDDTMEGLKQHYADQIQIDPVDPAVEAVAGCENAAVYLNAA